MNDFTYKKICSADIRKLCNDYVELKRASGLKYDTGEKTLSQFARYCEKIISEEFLSNDAIYNWINNTENQSLKTKLNNNGVMTGWAQYVFSLGYEPLRLPSIRHTRNTAFIPHIFTDSEMQKIWKCVDNIKPSHRYPNLHRCIPVLFRLLYGCGLRIGEALQIRRGDIDFVKNIITLNHTKLDKERLIPMSDSLAVVIKKYVESNKYITNDDSLIFFYRKDEPLSEHSVYGRFRLTLENSGIPYEGKLRGPRLHDFRHTFAVKTMNRLSDEGNDLYVILPILSAYLGHSGIETTEKYIRLTEERLSTISDSMQLHLPDLFPEVNDNEGF